MEGVGNDQPVSMEGPVQGLRLSYCGRYVFIRASCLGLSLFSLSAHSCTCAGEQDKHLWDELGTDFSTAPDVTPGGVREASLNALVAAVTPQVLYHCITTQTRGLLFELSVLIGRLA
jgi:hypothetical protein